MKKLQGNGLFESSRMMLPEHKEAYIQYQQQIHVKERPILDSQQIELFSRLIAESMYMDKEILIILYDQFEEKKITGKVSKIDQQSKQIKINYGSRIEWIHFQNIIHISSSY